MPQFKNVSFPFCARRRENTDQNLIGVESLEHLNFMPQLDKEEQYLFFYNFRNTKSIKEFAGRKIPYFVKTTKRTPQTTCVIDFDKIPESQIKTVRDCFEVFNQFLDGKALLESSPSGGLHVIYVVRGAIPQDEYCRLQEYVISRFFRPVELFLDAPTSKSVQRGFYHSQHLFKWVNLNLVNATPGLQKKRGFFWNQKIEIQFDEFVKLQDFCKAIEERKNHELVADAFRMLDYLCFLIKRGQDAAKTKEYSQKIIRIMAALRQRESNESKSSTEKICSRAQKEQYQAAVKCVESFAGKRIFGAQTVSEIHRGMVREHHRERSEEDSSRDSENTQTPRGDCLPGNNPESGGHGHSSYSGNARVERGRLSNNSGDEHILGFISSLRDGLKARNISNKELGHLVQSSALRSNSDWDHLAEEPNLDVFISVLREVVDEHPGLGRYSEVTSESIFLWLRHSSRYIRSRREHESGLSEFAANAARCFRLYLKTQNIKVNLSGHEFQRVNTVSEEESARFVEWIEAQLPTHIRELSKDNAQTILKLFREDKKWLIAGTGAFLSRIKSLYPFLKQKKPIALGMEDFQEFFQTHTRKASALRRVYMSALAVQTNEYIPCISRKKYLINHKILENIMNFESKTPNSPEDLIPLLGEGRTWETMRKYIKPMYESFGVSRVESIWYTALELSSAKNPEKRKQDVTSFLTRLESQKDSKNGITL